MEKNNSVVMQGTLRTNRGGVKTMNVWGGIVTVGYNVRVEDEEGRFLTSMQIKTDNKDIAKKLADSEGQVVELEGYLRSENTISKGEVEEAKKNGVPDDKLPSRWITYVYVRDVYSSQTVTANTEPQD